MKLFLVLSLLALHVCATPTGIVKPKGRIFNGVAAAQGQLPYHVNIRLGGRECSGAILSKDWVITAGGCVRGSPYAEIRAGSIYRRIDPADPKRVIIQADKWNDTFTKDRINPNNIGLIKLKTPLTFNAYIQPIRLQKKPVDQGTVLRVSGWGAINRITDDTNNLQYVDLKVISPEECRNAFIKTNYDSYRLCANGTTSRRQHICRGDVGGPLVLNAGTEPLLVGIGVEKGLECGTQDYSSAFVKVYKFIDWIEQTTDLDFS